MEEKLFGVIFTGAITYCQKVPDLAMFVFNHKLKLYENLFLYLTDRETGGGPQRREHILPSAHGTRRNGRSSRRFCRNSRWHGEHPQNIILCKFHQMGCWFGQWKKRSLVNIVTRNVMTQSDIIKRAYSIPI